MRRSRKLIHILLIISPLNRSGLEAAMNTHNEPHSQDIYYCHWSDLWIALIILWLLRSVTAFFYQTLTKNWFETQNYGCLMFFGKIRRNSTNGDITASHITRALSFCPNAVWSNEFYMKHVVSMGINRQARKTIMILCEKWKYYDTPWDECNDTVNVQEHSAYVSIRSIRDEKRCTAWKKSELPSICVMVCVGVLNSTDYYIIIYLYIFRWPRCNLIQWWGEFFFIYLYSLHLCCYHYDYIYLLKMRQREKTRLSCSNAVTACTRFLSFSYTYMNKLRDKRLTHTQTNSLIKCHTLSTHLYQFAVAY